MLGAMMARAAGWDDAMRPVEVHKYNTPTAENRDCPYSIGVLNLTEREAEVIAQFARGIRSVTSDRARGLTATQMRERQGPATRFFEEDKTRATAHGASNPRSRMKFTLGMLTAVAVIVIAIWIDPMISAHVWCAVTQSARCM